MAFSLETIQNIDRSSAPESLEPVISWLLRLRVPLSLRRHGPAGAGCERVLHQCQEEQTGVEGRADGGDQKGRPTWPTVVRRASSLVRESYPMCAFFIFRVQQKCI